MCVCGPRGEWANLLLHVQVTLLLRLHQLRLALVFIELSSAPGLGSPLPHLHQDWARPCHICARTGLTSAQLAAQTLPAVTPPFPPAEGARADRFRAALWRETPAAVGEGGLDLQHAVALALLCEDSIQMRHLRAQPLELREQIAVLCARALSVLRREREPRVGRRIQADAVEAHSGRSRTAVRLRSCVASCSLFSACANRSAKG